MTEINNLDDIEAAIALKRNDSWHHCSDKSLLQSLLSGMLQGASKFGLKGSDARLMDHSIPQSSNGHNTKSATQASMQNHTDQ